MALTLGMWSMNSLVSASWLVSSSKTASGQTLFRAADIVGIPAVGAVAAEQFQVVMVRGLAQVVELGLRQLGQQHTETRPVLHPELDLPLSSLPFQRVDTSVDQLALRLVPGVLLDGVRKHLIDRLQQMRIGLDRLGSYLSRQRWPRPVAWSRFIRPSANFSLSLGRSDIYRSTFAICLDSRRDRRAWMRRTSTGPRGNAAPIPSG